MATASSSIERQFKGLVNQGWKDSNDSMFHHDGTLAEGPIALCEVQGYVYRAQLGWRADLAGCSAIRTTGAALLVGQQSPAERSSAAFWCEELGTYALALDGEKAVPRAHLECGALLLSGIASAERAERVARTLLRRDRSRAGAFARSRRGEPRYNPMSYHNGSIWPHDNAMIGEGLARYGIKEGP